MKTDILEYTIIKPNAALSDYVESFWMLANNTKHDKEIIVLPDGRVDLIFSYTAKEPLHAMLMSIDSNASKATFTSKSAIFAVSFKLLAVEDIFNTKIGNTQSHPIRLADNFWGISTTDLSDFKIFYKKVSEKILALAIKNVDERKQKLFQLIYSSNGSMPVKELSEKVFWSSRQINRYFNQQFGISLKAYCNILRFRASFKHISEGKLFPEQDFADQNHFIKDIKKYSGVTPKELSRNRDDRFVHITVLKKPSS